MAGWDNFCKIVEVVQLLVKNYSDVRNLFGQSPRAESTSRSDQNAFGDISEIFKAIKGLLRNIKRLFLLIGQFLSDRSPFLLLNLLIEFSDLMARFKRLGEMIRRFFELYFSTTSLWS